MSLRYRLFSLQIQGVDSAFTLIITRRGIEANWEYYFRMLAGFFMAEESIAVSTNRIQHGDINFEQSIRIYTQINIMNLSYIMVYENLPLN